MGKAAADAVTTVVEPPFNSGEGEHQEVGDAAGGPVLVVVEMQDDLNFRRQFGHQRADMILRFVAKQLLQRTWRRTALRRQQMFEPIRFGRLAAPVPLGDAPGAIAGDGI